MKQKTTNDSANSINPIDSTDATSRDIEHRLASKKKALEVAFAQINKAHGNGVVMVVGQSPPLILKLFQPDQF